MTHSPSTQSNTQQWLAVILFILVLSLYGTVSTADAAMTFKQNKLLYQAQKTLNIGDAAQCIRMLEDHIAEQQDQVPYQVYSLLGASYHLQKDYSQAAKNFTTALNLQPEDTHISTNLATCYYLDSHYKQAGEQFAHSYLLSNSTSPELLYQSAIAFIQGGDYGDAKHSLTALLDSGVPAKNSWYELLLSCHIELQEWQLGQQLLDQLLSIQPAHEPYWRLKAQISMQQEQFLAAAAALEVALHLSKDNYANLTQLASLYRYLQAPLRAADLLKRAYGTTPTAQQSAEIARLYHQGYAFEQALSEMHTALQNHPNDEELLNLNAQLLYDSGNYQQLLELAVTPELPSQNLLQGYAAWQLGQWQVASSHFNRALKDRRFAAQARNALEVINLLAEAKRECEI